MQIKLYQKMKLNKCVVWYLFLRLVVDETCVFLIAALRMEDSGETWKYNLRVSVENFA